MPEMPAITVFNSINSGQILNIIYVSYEKGNYLYLKIRGFTLKYLFVSYRISWWMTVQILISGGDAVEVVQCVYLQFVFRAERTQQEPCKHCPSIWSSLKAEMMKVPSNAWPGTMKQSQVWTEHTLTISHIKLRSLQVGARRALLEMWCRYVKISLIKLDKIWLIYSSLLVLTFCPMSE